MKELDDVMLVVATRGGTKELERGLDKTVPKWHVSVENCLETFCLSVSFAVSENITMRRVVFSISFMRFNFVL